MNFSDPLDIVMVTWNRPEMTERSIREIADKTKNYRLVVIDNGSSQEMKKLLKRLKKEGLIHELELLKHNIGLEPAKNVGMRFVKSRYFVSTDNDCLPQKGWLPRLVVLMNKNHKYAAIACRTQVMIGTGNIYDGHEDEDIVEFPHPGGSLRIMRTDSIYKAGMWRGDVNGRGSEEKHICGKLRELGYKTGYAVKIRCYHMFGKDSNWGYGEVKPEEHGHNPIWHPAIQNGDNEEDIKRWLNGDGLG